MSRTRSILSITALIAATSYGRGAWAQTLPCITNFSDGTTQGWSASPDEPNETLTVPMNGGPNGAGDRFLKVHDNSGNSSITGPCTGDWLTLARNNHGCLRYCFDVKNLNGGGGSPYNPSFTLIFNRGQPDEIRASFISNTTIAADGQWHRVCAPLDQLNGGNLPASGGGTWQMQNGAPNSSWNTLLANVGEVRLHFDFESGGGEEVGFDNVTLEVDPNCKSKCNKDLKNTTGTTVNDFEWLVRGHYDSVIWQWPGPAGHSTDGGWQNYPNTTFGKLDIIPSGPNTIFHWSGGNASIPPDGIAHVGLELQGRTIDTIGVSWTIDGHFAGCAKQVGTQVYGGNVIFSNTATACHEETLYVGDIRVEWHAAEVSLGDLMSFIDRHPMRTDVINQPPLPLAPNASLPVVLQPPPPGANWMVLAHTVSAGPQPGSASTTDFTEFHVDSSGSLALAPRKSKWRWGILASLFMLAGGSMIAVRRKRSRAATA